MRLHCMVVLTAPWLMAGACRSEPTGLTSTQESAVLVNDLNDPAWPKDAITLDSAVVTGEDRLRLFTQYGGGCEEHAAALLVDRAFMESFPPVLRARIAHDARNDSCRALVSWTIEVDLKTVRDHYRQSYGAGSGSLVLDVDGQRVTYVFQ